MILSQLPDTKLPCSKGIFQEKLRIEQDFLRLLATWLLASGGNISEVAFGYIYSFELWVSSCEIITITDQLLNCQYLLAAKS